MVERRLTWLAVLVLAWGGAIFYKLISLQVLHHQEYVKQARLHQEVVREIPAPRGTIFDRNGQPLAMSIPTEAVYVNPLKIPDIGVAADLLSQFLHMDREELYGRLKSSVEKSRGYLVIKKKITFDEGQHLRNLAIDWIKIQTDSQRHYPNGALAAHILGGVDFSEHGNGGIEKSLENELRGVPGQERLLTDVKRRGIDSQNATEARPGTAITLTIDERLQFVAERELAAGVAAHNAISGSIVVMNPNTGDILAMASYPTFDPNLPPISYEDVVHRQNHATAVPFEPGSVFKVITLSAALETTHLRPESMIDCGRGSITLFGRTIHEAHGGYGTISMADVLKHSSNVGAIRVGMTVGQANMYQYVKKFGFGDRTGVPLPGESRGRLRGLKQWGSTSLASVSMGQEVSVTTLQLARAISVVANGGLLVRPRLILKRADKTQPMEQPVRILQAETAITMRQIMEGVVLPGGTGFPEARLAGYSVAGKTGSAQIFDFATKHYTHNYNGSFVGLVPITNPSMVVVVTLNGTHGTNGYGGRAAAPVFHAVTTEALRLLEIPKDLPDEPAIAAASVKPADADEDVAIADLGSEPNILLDSEDADDAAPPVATGPTVPNFKGKTMRDVMAQAASMGLIILPAGSGVARIQVPAAGTALHEGERIRVQFSR
ncbi:MAG TPA: penicillin-binding protein [Candidatus Sulfopaludibacter sp.]|jgi:cell division protein FtsI (penicillin-binding protein 3)|nr:penicillin-binding protein [Candidatus Sulfopaludibacter sp.]